MDRETIALIFQQGGRFITELIRNRPRKREMPEYGSVITTLVEPQETENENKATSVEAGCVPCAIGHFSTCSGVLAESMRFARSDGLNSNEVIDRITHCLEELNTMEREDLSPQKIANLSAWEKELANRALTESRATRHRLESISTVSDLEQAAADAQTSRQEIGRAWFKQKLSRMPKEEKTKIALKAMEKIEGEE